MRVVVRTVLRMVVREERGEGKKGEGEKGGPSRGVVNSSPGHRQSHTRSHTLTESHTYPFTERIKTALDVTRELSTRFPSRHVSHMDLERATEYLYGVLSALADEANKAKK